MYLFVYFRYVRSDDYMIVVQVSSTSLKCVKDLPFCRPRKQGPDGTEVQDCCWGDITEALVAPKVKGFTTPNTKLKRPQTKSIYVGNCSSCFCLPGMCINNFRYNKKYDRFDPAIEFMWLPQV